MMMRLALHCCTVAMATFAAGSPQCTPTATLDYALQTAGVRDPTAMGGGGSSGRSSTWWRSTVFWRSLCIYLDLYSIEYTPQQATPYIDLFVNANLAMYTANSRAPLAQLLPEDLALLATDPALCSRYCELAVAMVLPSLRRLSMLFAARCTLSYEILRYSS
jgi:hypothetical protein